MLFYKDQAFSHYIQPPSPWYAEGIQDGDKQEAFHTLDTGPNS